MFKVKYKHNLKRHHGKRARRQAFYRGQRLARYAERILRQFWTQDKQEKYEKAILDSVVYGTGYFDPS